MSINANDVYPGDRFTKNLEAAWIKLQNGKKLPKGGELPTYSGSQR